MDRLTGTVANAADDANLPPLAPQPPATDRAQAHGTGRGYRYSAAARPGRLLEIVSKDSWLICAGSPYAADSLGNPAAILEQFAPGREALLGNLGGEFALAYFDARQRTLALATDLFGSIPLYYASGDRRISFGTDLDRVCSDAGIKADLDPQALYDYLFFSVVPGNRCVLLGATKVPPASVLIWRNGHIQVARYWQPGFGSHAAPDQELRQQTIAAISNSVSHVAKLPGAGCFLSGGLDSSTVCGMAARHNPEKMRAFTIGFDVPQYDETRYARITAEHFRLDLHEYQIKSRDVAACVERVVHGFPEPFGNPSALPAYLCARFAREAGIRHLLAGDGGDELFAGNERYQKQALFNQYSRMPTWARRGLVDPLARVSTFLPGPLHKLASYVSQARVPLPDRLFSYNLLVRNNPESVLTKEFLATVDIESPYRYARMLFAEPETGDFLDRLLYLDWTTTLTDNDLMKVSVGCALAGVTPYFPLLDPAVINVSTRIPSESKMSRTELRKFYKEAFGDFLPTDVLRKRKHGFGVPVGIWINTDETLQERFRSRLTSLERRGIVQPGLLAELLAHLAGRNASYYGALLWPLFALEEWLQGHNL